MTPTYYPVRSSAEVDDVLNQCVDAEATGASRYPGMIYEEGVRAGIEWVLGQSDDPPFDPEETGE